MRWTRAEHLGRQFFAIVEEAHVVRVEGSPFGDYARTAERLPLEAVKLLPPVIPPTFYAAGMNYRGHANEMTGRLGEQKAKIPTQADIGYRANNALIGNGDLIVIPHGSSDAVQYEPELVVVIGKKARNIAEADALSVVFGYTIGNDVSERTWQASDRTLWRAKNSDTFKPMGPWIETDVSLERLVTRVRLNGAIVSEFPTNDMVFGVARYISEITRFITLFPGDVIWMGAEAPTRDMVAGDHVEIDIDGIGTLSNPIVAEQPS
jgi:2-keto-4-pentenoate hydratase/2-oxohepta-3-ene-1,7-dioic acid hydratase in catechol pathway